MKKSVKNLMPIPEGYTVLSPKQERGKTVWLNRDHNGYEPRLAEYADGATALYLVKPNGSIVPDRRSVMVNELNCPACGERMNPATDKTTGVPQPCFTAVQPVVTAPKFVGRMNDYERPCTH